MKKSAFSLIELAVVLVVIAALIVGVMSAKSLITMAHFTKARSQMAEAQITTIPCLMAWYETAAKDSFKEGEVLNNSSITQWRDISSQTSIANLKNLLTPSGSVLYKVKGINDLPAAYFDGTSYMNLGNFYQGDYSQYTAFVVFKPLTTVNSTPQTLLDSSPSSLSDSAIAIKNNAISLNAGSSAETSTASNAADIKMGGAYIMVTYLDNTHSRVYINDTITMVGNAEIIAGSNPIHGLTIGVSRALNNGFNGLVSEVILFSCPIKSKERGEVMRYLSNKYAIKVNGLN